jgi:hypothetical protein
MERGAGCPHEGKTMSSVQHLIDDWLRFRWQSNPVEATFVGVHDYDVELGDYGPEHLEERRLKEADFLRRLRQVTPDGLSPQDAIDRRLAVSELEADQKLLEHASPWARDPCVYPELCLSGLFLPLVRDYAPVGQRAATIVARLGEIPKVMMQARASLSKPVRLFAEVALEVARGGRQFIEGALPLLGEHVPSLRGDIGRAIRGACEALEGFEEHLKDRVIPSAEERFALGSDLFGFLLREKHMLPYGARDLLGIGEDSIRTTLEELQSLTRQHRATGSWMDWVDEAKDKHPDAGALKSAYEGAMMEAKRFVLEKDLVTIPPGESLELIWTPEFERSQIPYAAYMPAAPLEEQQKGLFYVTPIEEELPAEERARRLRGSCYAGIPVTALHEGYPGHHLQLSIANRHPSLLRRVTWSSLFGEGWALYCEDLMFEHGFYRDSASRLMQLKDLLWRSVRVVLDVRLHTEQMSFQEAVEALVGQAKLEVPNARAEVKRYARTPTQPMSYLIGKRLILDMLARYRRAAGAGFNEKAFHDRLLSAGNLPPALAEKELSGGELG